MRRESAFGIFFVEQDAVAKIISRTANENKNKDRGRIAVVREVVIAGCFDSIISFSGGII